MSTKKINTKKVNKSEIQNKNGKVSGLQKTKKVSTLALVLGILFAVQLIGEIIFQIVHTAKGHGEDTFSKVFLYVRSCLCIAEIVLAIIIWANTKLIKEHSKANILLFIVGLPILFGVAEIVEFVVIIMAATKAQLIAGGWVFQTILWLGLIGSATISFIGYTQIRSTIK